MNRLFGIIKINLNQEVLKPNIFPQKHYAWERVWNNSSYFIGNQDISKSDNNIAEEKSTLVIFQGNLFYESDKETAAKIILNRYKKQENLSFVKNLNGSFNFLLLDKTQKSIFLVTDKYGSKPLFVYTDKEKFIFGSEVKYILSLLNNRPTINWEAWGQYLTFRSTLGDNTFYHGIRLISNGTILKIKYGEKVVVSKKEYWDFSQIHIDYDKSFEEKISEGVEIFRDVFGELGRVTGNFKSIVALSGEFDSRSIVCGLKKYSPLKNFDTATTLHPCGSEKEIVLEIVNALSLKNIYINRPKNIYRDFFIKKAYLTDCLVQEHLWIMPLLDIAKNYDVYIDGIPGDIIMRSTRVRPIHIEKKDNAIFLAKLFKKQFGFEFDWLKSYIDENIWNQIKYSEDWTIDELNKIRPTENRMVVFLMKNRVKNSLNLLPNNIIGSSVKNVFQPFFNDNIVRFGLSIPHEYKFKFIYRQIINKAFPEIENIRSTSDENLEKLKNYDQKILQFDQNPRELISDYLTISPSDSNFLFNLLKKLPSPTFLNKQKFLNDTGANPIIHKVNTLLEIILWFNMFENKKLNKEFISAL